MTSTRNRFLEDVARADKRQKVAQPQRHYYGLRNQGATCYLNSVLQVLFMTTEINNRLDPKSQITDEELRNLFEKLNKTTCGTEKITKSFDIKNVHHQCDAAECLELILHNISPKASEVFRGKLTYTTKCTEKDHNIIDETNPFWVLPLSLKDADDTTYSVERGFRRIFEPKFLRGDNLVFCNECGIETEAKNGCDMVKYPQILVLLLKRFDIDYSTMSHVKSDRCVDVPLMLRRKDKEYKLYGMVNHFGGLRGGHYTATILSSEDKTWYEFNDEHVDKVKDQPFADTKTYSSSAAYLLVYRATGSPTDSGKKRPYVGGQRESQREQNRNWEADDKEIRCPAQNQESQRLIKKDVKKEALSPQVPGKSFDRDIVDENVLHHPKQNRSYSSKQRPYNLTTAKDGKQRCKTEDGGDCPQPCTSPTDIKKKPLWIFFICFVCALVLILIITFTTLNKS